MEDKNNTTNPWKMSCGDKCGSCNGICSMCGHGCGGYKRHLCKKILMLVFIIIVFCFGVQLGTLKGELRAGYKFMGIMSGNRDDFGRQKMMWTYQNPASPQVNIPVTQ
jgi:hypothetical protein